MIRAEAAASPDVVDLRYPIGKHTPRAAYSNDTRAAAIENIARLPQQLREAIERLSNAQLDAPYRPDGWSVRQVVHHLADAHSILYARVKIALTETNPLVKTWDEASWAELPDAREMPIDDSMTIVGAVHARLAYLLGRLTPCDLSRTMRHPVWGVIPIDQLVDMCDWHGRHHTAHIRALRVRSGW
jgi:DinB family protein